MFYYQNTIAIVHIVFPLLAILAVLARLSARRLVKLPFGHDDWLIIVALVVTVAEGISTVVAVYTIDYGDIITKPFSQDVYKFIYVDGILMSFVIGIIKCSVVTFYKRIFVTHTFTKVANVVLLLCISWTIASTLTKMFQTTPVSKYWTDRGYTSINVSALFIALNVTDLVLDLVILSLPLPVIRKLHISPKKRLAVIGIFGLGIFCVIAICVRLYYFLLVPSTKNSAYIMNFPEEATAAIDASFMWVDIECSVSIITACLPTLVPIFAKMKTITVSLGSDWNRLKRSKTSMTSHSDDSLKLEPVNLSKSHKKGSSTDFETGKSHEQIQATTVISVA